MEKENSVEREKERFERKWAIDGMIPNRSIIRRNILKKIIIDALVYGVSLAIVIEYGLYTGIIYALYPFFIGFFIAFAFVIVFFSLYTGTDPFALLKRKIRSWKRDIGKK